jgi:hypothetical protein
MSGFSQPIGQLAGTPTNDAANTGFVGETVDGSAALSSVSLTNATAANLTSISLTAGDWEISGAGYFLPAATTTVLALHASIGTTPATKVSTIGRFGAVSFNAIVMAANENTSIPVPPFRLSLAAPATVFLVGWAQFGTSTCAAGGTIHARRLR